MQRRNFLRVSGGGFIAAATLAPLASMGLSGCSPTMPESAVEAWKGPAPELANTDVRRWILSYAILAPHAHNLQSWVVDLQRDNEIVLRCDVKRLLPHTDPLSRQIMLSQGTFLELLDLAAKARGLRADISLFPEGAHSAQNVDARPVARIRLEPDASVQKDPLFAQALLRHTHRGAYDIGRPVPDAAWQTLTEAARAPGLRLGYVGSAQAAALDAHRKLAAQAWRIELTTPRTVMESYELLRVGADEIAQHRDGISLLDTKVVLLNRFGLLDRSTAPAADAYATTSQISSFENNLATTPGFVWLTSTGNDRITQVNAGRAYVRLQLAATALGLSMHPLSQALQEYPEQRQPYADAHALLGATRPAETVQMWTRIGYAQPVTPSPRRRLGNFIQA
ncbi:Acg family FMN-binding oxidoreductase [Rhodoferax sp.]|jgi:hypothetical protein|uniref:Acg family FMN-binding oxidoreductase n=1 Tax=Rhodoferax sp. TaxID=50421 RepID=UPI0037844D16